MTYRITEIDGSEAQKKYHTGKLLAKMITAADLSEAQVRELFACDASPVPSRARCVKAACERILRARENGEKVFVGGDYDADGICSTAIMKKTLDLLNIRNGYYIPDRFKEGYGLSDATVRLAHEKGYSLIITVDNGVKAHAALAEARKLHMDTIVTDHHRIEEKIDADIVVHPDYMEEDCRYLSGAGVALEISMNLVGMQDDLIALAAVAAIGDVMPLWKETRKIVLAGMNIMKRRIPRSLSVMFRPGSPVSWTTIAFQIVPKLNSVGRMNDLSNVNTLIPFLLSKDENAILKYAAQLDHVNEVRKQLSESQTHLAEKQITDDEFLIIHDPRFHEGVCGLVAGRLASAYCKPVLVMAENGGMLKGSGRSVSGFDMFAFFAGFEETSSFGGHEQAVGLSIPKDQYEAFCAHVREKMKTVQIAREEDYPAIAIAADDVSLDELMDLERADPLPKEMNDIFAITDVQVLTVRETAGTVRYQIACAYGPLEGILYKRKGIEALSDPHLMIGRLSVNRWRSSVTARIEIEEMR